MVDKGTQKIRLPRSIRLARERYYKMRWLQNEPDPNRWPVDLRIIFIAIADALAGRPLTPETIASIADLDSVKHALADHYTTLSYNPKDKSVVGARSSYTVAFKGSRWGGSWTYFHGQFSNALSRCKIGL